MNFIEFINTCNDKTGSRKLPPVFCFVGKKYPALFFQHLRKVYQHKEYVIQSLDCQTMIADGAYKSHLEMSFLGNTYLYWLAHIVDLDIKQQVTLQNYLEKYEGPHTVYFFVDKPLQIKISTIDLAHDIDIECYVQLFSLFFPDQVSKSKNPVILALFRKYKVIPLEDACLLMQYALVLGSKIDYESVAALFDTLIVPEKSLFVLSTLFFAKQDREFFQLWYTIKDEYSDVFWTTYWSEQLFRAYCFIELMQKKDFAQAKKSAFRLPFSFVQRDWKNIKVATLKTAHDHITTIDWNIKNGISPYFEHFFLTVLS